MTFSKKYVITLLKTFEHSRFLHLDLDVAQNCILNFLKNIMKDLFLDFSALYPD